ncbi:hypothetical protein [Evansella cellulosilytica]|uniref:Methionine aminopeptidase n=1 Tax=Evansella cellulosilytica (strain ATCC 21833 / DSM 2522 / FERM P-1141 / JCM 9156 / N-4) TaxID=649639 RepID=E6TSD0_EVAC2|nr:hypothetical protein [Evansella cellulosilytica]ADU31899.1 hypothetical protein Bcell_3658 [Evansella cellulosilytica DSM 2522]
MGLLNAIAEWSAARYEKKVADMKTKGLCPDCNGYGYHMFSNEYFYMASHNECHGCSGSGAYDDWHETQQ